MMQRLIQVSIAAVTTTLLAASASSGEQAPNVTSDRYVVNQTFDGQSFFKDNNIWVYTPTFAEIFGMPAEAVDATLKGVEAAAFRIEDTSYKLCGMGGKAENCKDQYRCVIDIYLDETKTPLPWATEEKADWLAIYNSSYWLRTRQHLAVKPKVPDGVIENPLAGGVRPFADPDSHREANYFQNGDTPDRTDINFNSVPVFGYKRMAIAGLTLISLHHHCSPRNREKPVVTYRLESREKIFSPPLKRFHEFQLPAVFGDRIEAQLQSRWARDREYYKNLLNMK